MYHENLLKDTGVLEPLKAKHLKSLSAPLDAYWEEALIGFANHYEITIDGAKSGFFCLNGDNQLVALYLSPEYADNGGDVLATVIEQHEVKAALVGTNDPYFHSLCLDIAAKTEVHTLLFEDDQKPSVQVAGHDGLTFDRASERDFDEIFDHYCAASGTMDLESVENGYRDLKGYIRAVVDDHHIFVLRDNGTLIATSECRISKTQQPFADVGMIVAEQYRCKGFGSNILARTKAFCYERNLRPICSCEADNTGSQRAIAKAGFISRHQIVMIEFGV